MIDILRKLFEANPEKSTLVLKGDCSDCGCETTIEITPTSGGFGLNGGALIQYSSEHYLLKCHDCYHADSIIPDSYKLQSSYFPFRKMADHCQ